MKSVLWTASAAAILCAGAAFAEPADLPPNATPGHCYQRVFLPEQTETYQDRIVDTPERIEKRVIPAVYGEEERRVVLREARTELITIPATYRTVTETVVVRPATTRTEVVPAEYETITEQVLVREAHNEWRPGKPPRGVSYSAVKTLPTGEVLCLVAVPAEYKTVTRQVLKSPGRTVEIPVPAETRTLTRQVIDVDAHVEKRIIPAEYGVVKVRVVVQPERTETYTAPATYRYVTKTRVVSASRFEWQEFQCEKKDEPGYTPAPQPYQPPAPHPYHPAAKRTTYGEAEPPAAPAYAPRREPPAYASAQAQASVGVRGDTLVAKAQVALAQRGYYQGPADGLLTEGTRQAMARFQRDQHLREGAYTAETAQALGVL